MFFNLFVFSLAAVAIAATTIEPIEARQGGVACNQKSSIAARCSTQTTQQPTQSVLAKTFPEGLTGLAQLLAQILPLIQTNLSVAADCMTNNLPTPSQLSCELTLESAGVGVGVLNPNLNTL